jgi:phospholipid transport system transporter-binding protein
MSEAALLALGQGAFRLQGDLDFSTASALLGEARAVFTDYATVRVDLSAVDKVNSAGLALLLEWRDQTEQRGGAIHFDNPPEALLAIARMSNAEALLTG